MAAKAFSWRVIGITPAALDEFAAAGFYPQSRQGITRAHLRPRFDAVRKLLLPDKPLSERKFFETWLANDRTILCAKGESKRAILRRGHDWLVGGSRSKGFAPRAGFAPR